MPDLLCKDNMKIDPQILRQLREERSWTQEHLATVAGVSLRTIQRIERDGNASADSRLALASAFGIDVLQLSEIAPTSQVVPSPESNPPHAESPRSSTWALFRTHLYVYLAMGVFFVLGDYWENRTLVWAYWPLLGWGTGVLLHGWHTWKHQPLLDSDSDLNTKRALRRKGLQEHVIGWLVLSVVFVIGDVMTTGRLTWAFYPIIGWGAGLFLHYRALKTATHI